MKTPDEKWDTWTMSEVLTPSQTGVIVINLTKGDERLKVVLNLQNGRPAGADTVRGSS